MPRALFLDRDGVINEDVGYAHLPEHIIFRDGIFHVCRRFYLLGFCLIIVTNQSGIARGKFSEEQFHDLMQWMKNQFNVERCPISAVYYCPHSPASPCSCRKPRPGMFLQAEADWNIDLGRSHMVGDSETDMIAAHAAGVGKYHDVSREGSIKHLLDIKI